MVADDFAAEGEVIFGEGGGDLAGAALGEGPTGVVSGDGEHDADGGGEGLFEREDGMGGVAGEESAGFFGLKDALGEPGAGADGVASEASEEQGVLGREGEGP